MKHDVVIVGGGPGGAATAMFLIREGIKPAHHRGRRHFPRYHIGESMTGAGGKVLRDLDLAAEMYRRKYPTKQGVKVYGQSTRGSWFVPVTGRDENWKLFDWDTWQVRRSDFDKMMLDEAVSRGASLMRGKALQPAPRRLQAAVSGVKVRMPTAKIEDIESRDAARLLRPGDLAREPRRGDGPQVPGRLRQADRDLLPGSGRHPRQTAKARATPTKTTR